MRDRSTSHRGRMQTGKANQGLLAGSSLPSRFPIATGWCSPALPTKVYERSNPSGPSTFISQLSFARDPMIDTCHSPGLSLSTCSMRAAISPRVRGSPVFCISTLAAMSPIIVQSGQAIFLCTQPVQNPMDGALCRRQRPDPSFQRTKWGDCRPRDQAPFEMVFHNFC